MRKNKFKFLEPGPLIDNDLELVLARKTPPDHRRGYAPVYSFNMLCDGSRGIIGSIDLRIGNTEDLVKYSGHFGYRVTVDYRGNRYAARSLKLLLPLARTHNLNPVWVTCNPDNPASRRTCEIAGGKLIDTVDLPKNNNLYKRGERQKCRYRFDL
ncbi:MAG: GNAT family N-acetyltransferase [Candidatus Adiutricales bacterium]